MQRFLKAIHNFFLLFGINISFVKKPKDVSSAIEHNTESSMDAYYTDKSNRHELYGHERLQFYNAITNLLKEKGVDLNNKSVADMGCGTGKLLEYIDKQFEGVQFSAYEFSQEALNIAEKAFPAATYFKHDIYDETGKHFDFLFCTEVLEHLLYPGRALNNLLKSMNLQESGLLITVPNGRLDTYTGHINFWSPESWLVFIKENARGFEVETGFIEDFSMYALIQREKR